MLPLVLSFYFTTCNSASVNSNSSPSPKNERSEDTTGKHYFIDVDDLGPCKIIFNDAAAAHQQNAATKNKLSQARDTMSLIFAHRGARGLTPQTILEVKQEE